MFAQNLRLKQNIRVQYNKKLIQLTKHVEEVEQCNVNVIKEAQNHMEYIYLYFYNRNRRKKIIIIHFMYK